jgi:hypothetical protein
MPKRASRFWTGAVFPALLAAALALSSQPAGAAWPFAFTSSDLATIVTATKFYVKKGQTPAQDQRFLYVAGSFRGSMTLPLQSGQMKTVTSAGLGDIFVAKLTDGGEILWVTTAGREDQFGFGGELEDSVNAIDVDNDGNPYITGGFCGGTQPDQFPTVTGDFWNPYSQTPLCTIQFPVGAQALTLVNNSAAAEGYASGSTWCDGNPPNVPESVRLAQRPHFRDWQQDLYAAKLSGETGAWQWALKAGGALSDFGSDIISVPGGALVAGSVKAVGNVGAVQINPIATRNNSGVVVASQENFDGSVLKVRPARSIGAYCYGRPFVARIEEAQGGATWAVGTQENATLYFSESVPFGGADLDSVGRLLSSGAPRLAKSQPAMMMPSRIYTVGIDTRYVGFWEHQLLLAQITTDSMGVAGTALRSAPIVDFDDENDRTSLVGGLVVDTGTSGTDPDTVYVLALSNQVINGELVRPAKCHIKAFQPFGTGEFVKPFDVGKVGVEAVGGTCRGIADDEFGGVFVVGDYANGTLTLTREGGQGQSSQNLLPAGAAVNTAVFLAKLGMDGWEWVVDSDQTSGDTYIQAAAVAANGYDIAVGGRLNDGPAMFGIGTLGPVTRPSSVGFVARASALSGDWPRSAGWVVGQAITPPAEADFGQQNPPLAPDFSSDYFYYAPRQRVLFPKKPFVGQTIRWPKGTPGQYLPPITASADWPQSPTLQQLGAPVDLELHGANHCGALQNFKVCDDSIADCGGVMGRCGPRTDKRCIANSANPDRLCADDGACGGMPGSCAKPVSAYNVDSVLYSEITGASVSTQQPKRFVVPPTSTGGYSVLLYKDADQVNPQLPDRLEVVRTGPITPADVPSCPIGMALDGSVHGHADPHGGNGWLINAKARVNLDPDIYKRDEMRTGVIIPVNESTVKVPGQANPVTEELTVAWYAQNAIGIAWPSMTARYDCDWPDNAEEIVIENERGAVLSQELMAKGPSVYVQNDHTAAGFNPNEEHALVADSKFDPGRQAVFALRTKLNDDLGYSEPYVLLQYPATATSPGGMMVYKVVHGTQGTTEVNVTVGHKVEAPYPLSRSDLGGCAETCAPSKEECESATRCDSALCQALGNSFAPFKDAEDQLWARAKGPIKAKYHYQLRPDFYYPDPKPATNCVPWLIGDGSQGVYSYRAEWPTENSIPLLRVGETLTTAKEGEGGPNVPNVTDLNAARVIFETRVPAAAVPLNEPGSLVRLIDLESDRSVALPALPAALSDGQGGFKDGLLPPSLEQRLRHAGGRLIFSGRIVPVGTDGQSGQPFVLPNIMSDTERLLLRGLGDSTWAMRIDELYTCTQNPNTETVNGPCAQAGRLGFKTNQTVQLEEPGKMGLSAGKAEGPGYVTLALNNLEDDDPDLENPEDRKLLVVRVGCGATGPSGVYQGQLQVLTPANIFGNEVTVRYNTDFGGDPRMFATPPTSLEFEWYWAFKDQDCNTKGVPPATNPAGQGWHKLAATGPEIVFGRGGTSADERAAALADTCIAARYKGYPACGNNATPAQWSQWAGAALGGEQFTDPKGRLVLGWLSRVTAALNLFDQRLTDFDKPGNRVQTWTSALETAGKRFEGDVPLNATTLADENVGLIQFYETVLRRGAGLSIDDGLNVGAVNGKLLDVAARVSDLYMLFGNEAFGDAQDPTIGYSTSNMDGGRQSVQPNLWAFQGQTSSLLEEELALLRGIEEKGTAPVWNRLSPNFTTETIQQSVYVQNYGIRDQGHDGTFAELTGDGKVDDEDALVLYPQGHGDAWGHYLTAVKAYYGLLRHPNFVWEARSDSVDISGREVLVDFFDERKFAAAAAARARTGAHIVDLTYRRNWEDNPDEQWQGYKDDEDAIAFGVFEWAERAGQGAYLDWVTVNALLPPLSRKTGIARIDRTSVSELREIAGQSLDLLSQLENVDNGVNPLGLAKNAVPFDINPGDLSDPIFGATHFEQISERATTALKSAVTVFDHANAFTQLLRQQQDSSEDFAISIAAQERDYNSRLIEIFGTPYDGDGTYPDDYEGPDIINWDVVEASEITGGNPGELEGTGVCVGGDSPGAFCTDNGDCPDGMCRPSADVTEYTLEVPAPQFNDCTEENDELCQDDDEGNPNGGCTCKFDPSGKLRIDSNGVVVTEPINSLVRVSNLGFGKVKNPNWGVRESPGELQLARSEVLQARAQLERAIKAYGALIGDIECTLATIRGQNRLAEARLTLLTETVNTAIATNTVILAAKGTELVLRQLSDTTINLSDAMAEALPKAVGTSTDATAPARGAIKTFGTIAADGFDIAADVAVGVQLAAEYAADIQARLNELKLQGLEDDFEIYNLLGTLGERLRQEPVLRLEAFDLAERARQAGAELQATLGKGLRLWDELEAFRKVTAAEVARARYNDLAFRVFRNEALQKYRAQFDLAARYVYLAATAYDYETNSLGGDGSINDTTGRGFLTHIVRQRTLGNFNAAGDAVAGDVGLGALLQKMNITFGGEDGEGGLKSQLGINNPMPVRTRFSLRRELFRLLPASNAAWRKVLADARVDDLWQVEEFRRFARAPRAESAGPLPGLVIRFPTTITAGLNFFGKNLDGGDRDFNTSSFTTKVMRVALWFEDYDARPMIGLSGAPNVYLIPAGADVMRSPAGNDFRTREWTVIDQLIPQPPLLTTGAISAKNWKPADSFSRTTIGDLENWPPGGIRRWASFEAGFEGADNTEFDGTSRAVGRAVWNTNWVLIIPGVELLNNQDEGLNRFIYGQPTGGGGRIIDKNGVARDGNGVSDIQLNFHTYGIGGF